ncbi:MAG: hypothetical protein HY815_30850 [Candidatus Riflebacteria bacterium]|nr:hypothetical protein [Candidatus Riflebacteria bacterium]
MSERIHGLNCVRCQQPIEKEGLSCSACGAPHHVTCFNAGARCTSCECAKMPVPFAVTPPSGGRTVAAAGLVAVALLLLPLALSWQKPTHAQSRVTPSPFKVESWQPPQQAVLGSKLTGVPSEPSQVRIKSAPVSRERPFDFGRRVFSTQKDSRRQVVQLTQRPGRAQGHVSAAIFPEGEQDALELVLDQGRYTDAFLYVDYRRGARTTAGATLKAEVALSDRSSETPLEADRKWTQLAPVPVGGATTRWHRIKSPSPFNRVKLVLAGQTGELYLSNLVVLEGTQPPGEVVECSRFLTVTKLEGMMATLSNESDEHIRLPRVLLTDLPVPDVLAITSTEGSAVLRVGRDGAVGLINPQGNGSWGFDLGSLVTQSPGGPRSACSTTSTIRPSRPGSRFWPTVGWRSRGPGGAGPRRCSGCRI